METHTLFLSDRDWKAQRIKDKFCYKLENEKCSLRIIVCLFLSLFLIFLILLFFFFLVPVQLYNNSHFRISSQNHRISLSCSDGNSCDEIHAYCPLLCCRAPQKKTKSLAPSFWQPLMPTYKVRNHSLTTYKFWLEVTLLSADNLEKRYDKCEYKGMQYFASLVPKSAWRNLPIKNVLWLKRRQVLKYLWAKLEVT